MNATQVLDAYQAGERDFRRLNLKGQIFAGKDLSGANFTECDIRGAKFTRANLRGASFRAAKAGVQQGWIILLLIVSWLISAMVGLVAILAGALVAIIFNTPGSEYQILGLATSIVLVVFFGFTVFSGTIVGLGVLTGVGIITAIVSAFESFTFDRVAAAGAMMAGVGTLVGATAITGAGILIGTIGQAISTIIAIATAVIGGFILVIFKTIKVTDLLPAGIVALALIALTAYIAWQAIANERKYTSVRSAAIAFANIGGTSFQGANLTDVDLSEATLKSTDFRDSSKQPTRLIRTCWYGAKIHCSIRPGRTYLCNSRIQELLTTLQAQNQNFDRYELRGVNLQGANLADASLIGTDLREASLAGADLSRAKLVETLLDRADLSGTTLTGAYVENCKITNNTKLNAIKCKYVFTKVPTPDEPNPYRQPVRWEEEFEEGDFADFIQPSTDTLELYHQKDIDPRAIAIAFEMLVESNLDARIAIVSIQRRAKNKLVLKASIAPNTDSSRLSDEYFATYNRLRTSPESDLTKRAVEDDIRMLSLQHMIETFLERSGIHLEK